MIIITLLYTFLWGQTYTIHSFAQFNSTEITLNRNLLEMENDDEIEQKNTYRIKVKHNNSMIMIYT